MTFLKKIPRWGWYGLIVLVFYNGLLMMDHHLIRVSLWPIVEFRDLSLVYSPPGTGRFEFDSEESLAAFSWNSEAVRDNSIRSAIQLMHSTRK